MTKICCPPNPDAKEETREALLKGFDRDDEALLSIASFIMKSNLSELTDFCDTQKTGAVASVIHAGEECALPCLV
jgi:hypothetical protein